MTKRGGAMCSGGKVENKKYGVKSETRKERGGALAERYLVNEK